MFRTVRLSALNDLRLLAKDPVTLLMLLAAPVVIITVAGHSLGPIYGGGTRVRVLPVVDNDGGDVANRLLSALRAEPSVRVDTLADVAAARELVGGADGPPLAIEIAAGTSAALREGRSPRLVLHVDPVKRIEANAVEVRLAELCRRAAEEIGFEAQGRLERAEADLGRRVADLGQAADSQRRRLRDELESARAVAERALRARLSTAVETAGRRVTAQLREREERAWADVEAQISSRAAGVDKLRATLREARAGEAAFADWLGRLRELAGRHAADIPPPPPFPALPSDADLAALAEPIRRPALDREPGLSPSPLLPAISLPVVDLAPAPVPLDRLGEIRFGRLPGVLGFEEQSATPGAPINVSAFDQYVPGFGITFVLIGMMLGVALTLFDEREWGTLQRLQAGGASPTGLLLGKLASRFAVGIVQMTVLFAVGRVLFGVSLGREPAALLLPTAGICFAAAALGLVVSALAESRDGVMPLGTMLSMAISAIGGCWWPLSFEPGWMRAIARALPTTWTMQAYNDLMIRRSPWQAALAPLAATAALGLVYSILGLGLHHRRGAR